MKSGESIVNELIVLKQLLEYNHNVTCKTIYLVDTKYCNPIISAGVIFNVITQTLIDTLLTDIQCVPQRVYNLYPSAREYINSFTSCQLRVNFTTPYMA